MVSGASQNFVMGPPLVFGDRVAMAGCSFFQLCRTSDASRTTFSFQIRRAAQAAEEAGLLIPCLLFFGVPKPVGKGLPGFSVLAKESVIIAYC